MRLEKIKVFSERRGVRTSSLKRKILKSIVLQSSICCPNKGVHLRRNKKERFKMKKTIKIIIFLILFAQLSFSQIIDRYGVNAGASYSTQFWNSNLIPEPNTEYKVGFMAFISAEKNHGKFGLRAEIGYLQKGFIKSDELLFSNGSVIIKNKSVILHDLALNTGLKITPFKFAVFPYLFVGIRGDYMISHRNNMVFEEPGSGIKYKLWESLIDDFNKFNLGGLLGLGVDIKEIIYFEIEYNPNFTKNINAKYLKIKDNCYGVKLGVNINKFIK